MQRVSPQLARNLPRIETDDEVMIVSPKSRVTPKSHFGRYETVETHNHKQTFVREPEKDLLVSGSGMKKTITRAIHAKSRQSRLRAKHGSTQGSKYFNKPIS